MSAKILSVGEVLWDSLPGGLFLGGAPFNVACHLQMLGETVVMASRIGDDELGRQILRRLSRRNMATHCIQRDPDQPTGIVNVELVQKDQPEYDIVEPVAWDYLALDERLRREAENADILIYGTLAQRNTVSRKTIRALRQMNMFTVYDINLRPPYGDKEIVRESLQDADLVKLNAGEMEKLANWYGFPAAPLQTAGEKLAGAFAARWICITRGSDGALLWHDGQWTEHGGVNVEVRDTVGAGDAFFAALIQGVLQKHKPSEILAFANAVGAFVAGKDGATPELDMAKIRRLVGP